MYKLITSSGVLTSNNNNNITSVTKESSLFERDAVHVARALFYNLRTYSQRKYIEWLHTDTLTPIYQRFPASGIVNSFTTLFYPP